jgi:hypothetical protein
MGILGSQACDDQQASRRAIPRGRPILRDDDSLASSQFFDPVPSRSTIEKNIQIVPRINYDTFDSNYNHGIINQPTRENSVSSNNRPSRMNKPNKTQYY